MSEVSIGKEMLEKLSYKKKNVFEEATPEKIKAIYDYADGYMAYLDKSKTEREAVIASIKLSETNGYTEYKFGDKIAVGDKIILRARYYDKEEFKVKMKTLVGDEFEIKDYKTLSTQI